MRWNDHRIRVLSPDRRKGQGEYVLYWMQSARRMTHNHALDWALSRARELSLPLVVYEGVKLDYPWASRRLHRFLLEGMRDNLAEAEALGINYWPFVEKPGSRRAPLRAIAKQAAIVVTDDFPAFIVPEENAKLAATTDAPVIAIDGNGLVPLALLGAPPPLARSLRPRLHRALVEAWSHRPAPLPKVSAVTNRPVPVPFRLFDPRDLELLVEKLPLDASVPPAPIRGGSIAAEARLSRFIAHRLEGYARNHSKPLPPDEAYTSGLSPYLHFGHISISRIAEAVLTATGSSSARRFVAEAAGDKERFFGPDEDVSAFLDEALVWRDLGHLFLWYRREEIHDLERVLPAWALASLRNHASDRRAFVYSLEEWENAETHDRIWNAAQRELVVTGQLHNYMRMLWGKKILEWSASPEEAYRILLHLNDKYALDGRDPNSYTGILWCFGLFDRPWFPERQVLGRVRYMSSESTAKKFSLTRYLSFIDSLPSIREARGM